MNLGTLAAGVWLLGITACTVGRDFVRPGSSGILDWNDPSARSGATGPTSASDPDPDWWRGFRDPVLADLMHKATSENLDLQQAVLRVIEARQNVITARAAGLPSLNGTASYTREQYGFRGIIQSSGVNHQLGSLNTSASTNASIDNGLNEVVQPFDLFQYGLDASWELDLFGRVRRSVEQAKATAEAQEEATKDSLVMLESEIGQSYSQLRGAQALITTQEENIGSAKSSLQLTERRRRDGLASDLDVEQARTQLLNLQRQLPSYETQEQQAKNQLSVLVGQAPGALDAMLQASSRLPTTPEVIGIGLPSSLARRRPDVREAEANLHAMTANTGVAVAMFYPDVSLSGNLGLRAIDISYLTRWASHFYSAGPSVSLPIFQGGKLTANLRLARAQQQEAALKYRSTVLNALQEVENALVSYRNDRVAERELQQTVRSAEDTLYLSRSRYQNGLTDFLNVLNSQTTLTTSRQTLVQAQVSLFNDVVTLYRALGGGWAQTETPVPEPRIDPHPPIVPGALDSGAARP